MLAERRASEESRAREESHIRAILILLGMVFVLVAYLSISAILEIMVGLRQGTDKNPQIGMTEHWKCKTDNSLIEPPLDHLAWCPYT